MLNENIANAIKKIQELKPSLIGRFVYAALPIRYRIIKINIDLVFKDALSEALKKKLIQLIYSHLIKFITEFLLLPFLSTSRIKKRIFIKDEQVFSAQLNSLKENESAILISGHYGN